MKVSVCMATYNGGRYIKEQIDSILAQRMEKYPEATLELVISDDGSTDDTLDIVRSYDDDRIKLYHHKTKRKHRYFRSAFACTENFAHAMAQATGDYIFLSDQDDVWYPWKVETTLEKLIGGGKETVVGTAFDMGDATLTRIGSVVYKPQKFFALRYNHSLYGFSCGFHRACLRYILPMPGVPQHDTFIMLSAMARGKMVYVDRRCAMHRWTGVHNVSSGKNNNNVPLVVKLYYRVKMWGVVAWRVMF